MDGADRQIVVPLAPVVVDLDREQLAELVDEREDVGGRLLGEDGVPEVDDDADVIAVELVDPHERPGRGGEADVGARLLRLVLDGHADAGIHVGDRADAVELEPPQLSIVGLERVVEAVLARPQLHGRSAKLPRRVDALLAELQRTAPHGGVRVGERAARELARVDVGRDAPRAMPAASSALRTSPTVMSGSEKGWLMSSTSMSPTAPARSIASSVLTSGPYASVA